MQGKHYLYTSGGEFHSDGWFGFQIEFIAGKPGQKVTFADAWISNEDNWKSNEKIKVKTLSIRAQTQSWPWTGIENKQK